MQLCAKQWPPASDSIHADNTWYASQLHRAAQFGLTHNGVHALLSLLMNTSNCDRSLKSSVQISSFRVPRHAPLGKLDWRVKPPGAQARELQSKFTQSSHAMTWPGPCRAWPMAPGPWPKPRCFGASNPHGEGTGSGGIGGVRRTLEFVFTSLVGCRRRNWMAELA